MKQDKDAISWLYGIENKKSILDQIKEKYYLVKNKQEFIIQLAEKLEKRPLSIKNNWFTGYFAMPERYQSEVLEILTNFLKSE